ncbi:hypothetical protein DH2020_043612 [Rehmannia glutinosa]|uniref:DUF4283 domain-containing protein n=1 Tax=Rehmannia glutinosa TaxID=99300 RepID=A0ABR0UKV1_REHGL
MTYKFMLFNPNREKSETTKFSLTKEEEGGVDLVELDVINSTNECHKSLFGRIYGSKKANFSGLKNTMSLIWPTKEPFSVRELGHNLFQFVFKSLGDKKMVFRSRTWTFDNQFLILKEWFDGMEISSEEFNQVEVWVQIWNLPCNWISKETGQRIGSLFSSCSDIHIPEGGSSRGRHITLLVSILLDKPLMRGTFIKLGSHSV